MARGQCHLGAVTPSGLVALDSYPLNEEDGLSDSRGHSMTPYMMEKQWELRWDPVRVTRFSYDPQSNTVTRSPWVDSSGQGSVLCNASNTDLSSCHHPNCLFSSGPHPPELTRIDPGCISVLFLQSRSTGQPSFLLATISSCDSCSKDLSPIKTLSRAGKMAR